MSNDNDIPEATSRVSAIWYAFGRQDANHNPLVDVFDFATFYVAQRSTRGQSVQDAFAAYVAGLRCPEVGVRGTQCTQPAGHVDDCTFAF